MESIDLSTKATEKLISGNIVAQLKFTAYKRISNRTQRSEVYDVGGDSPAISLKLSNTEFSCM